jgi:hypothetical protein
MSIAYLDAMNKIRSRLQIPTTDTISVITNVDILATLNSAYSQWWRMFYDHPSGLTGAGTGANLTSGQGQVDCSMTDVVEVVAVYSAPASTDEPTSSAASPLERISGDEMRMLWRSYSTTVSVAAGMPANPANGAPVYYAIEYFQDDAKWKLTVYPKVDGAYYFPMLVRQIPAALVNGFTTHVCLDDEMVGLCALSALRLLPNVGKQNDQGIIQILMSEIPQEMQAMTFQPKAESVR